ncbi:MAG: hypothetical protein H0U23_17805 [Blastocatellia bacterium]|nr:hypothetical protein [Blastocatellia bacterium]
MISLKKWKPEVLDTAEERSIMVEACTKELSTSSPGDHSVYVGQDTLIYGVVDSDGKTHVYETKILSSNQDYRDQKDEGAAYVLTQNSGGYVS